MLMLASLIHDGDARTSLRLDHHARLDVEPGVDELGLAAGVLEELLPDEELRDQDVGQGVVEGEVACRRRGYVGLSG